MVKRKAIALLITVMFVIVISVVIGMSLRNVNQATQMVYGERELYENTLIVEDILHLLQNSSELKDIALKKDATALYIFLQNTQMLPFEHEGLRVVVHASSARSKLSLNSLTKTTYPYLYRFFSRHEVANGYVDMLLDCTQGIRKDGVYKSAIFERDKYLFRNYLASKRHLEKIEKLYKKEFADESAWKVNVADVVYLGEENNVTIDLNYATAEVWEIIAGVDPQEAHMLTQHTQLYEKMEDVPLGTMEKKRLKKFRTSFFEPFLNIKIDIIRNDKVARISFEYDIAKARGYNFVYEL